MGCGGGDEEGGEVAKEEIVVSRKRRRLGLMGWVWKVRAEREREGDDSRPKRMGNTRAKMLGLGKKMGEKLEERRRHIEEKGRNIVERMRAPEKSGS
ncbi:hypothetical protein AgCh_019999 [Apium graveolens]